MATRDEIIEYGLVTGAMVTLFMAITIISWLISFEMRTAEFSARMVALEAQVHGLQANMQELRAVEAE